MSRHFSKPFSLHISSLGVSSRRRLMCAAAIGGAVLVSGCTPDINQTGNLPDTESVRKLQIGQTSKADVIELIGNPSTQSAFSDKTWYYISQKRRRRALFKDAIDKQVVLALGFNERDVLQGSKVYTLKNGRLIRPAPGKTPTSGRQLSIIEQLIGNIGRSVE